MSQCHLPLSFSDAKNLLRSLSATSRPLIIQSGEIGQHGETDATKTDCLTVDNCFEPLSTKSILLLLSFRNIIHVTRSETHWTQILLPFFYQCLMIRSCVTGDDKVIKMPSHRQAKQFTAPKYIIIKRLMRLCLPRRCRHTSSPSSCANCASLPSVQLQIIRIW